jgi:hypothetical protein
LIICGYMRVAEELRVSNGSPDEIRPREDLFLAGKAVAG